MTTTHTDEPTIRATHEPGWARIEEEGNPDAWIRAEYREGWWRRKLMTDDKEPYMSMVEPFYLQCAACHRYESPELWGAGSPYCPSCELLFEYAIPRCFERMFGESGDQ